MRDHTINRGRLGALAKVRPPGFSLAILIMLVGISGGCDQGGERPEISSPQVRVSSAWARPVVMVPGDTAPTNTAIYAVISSSQWDTIIGVSSSVARSAEIHQTVVSDGVIRMRPAGKIPLGPGLDAVMESGGFHIMLIGLVDSLKLGDSITVNLEFASGLTVPVTAMARHSPPGP